MEVKEINKGIEFLENFLKSNPYPEDIFTPIPKEDFTKINNLLKEIMGYPIDRLFGNMGRKVYQTIGEDLKPIVPLLQQGEKLKVENIELKKYKEMWGWLDNMVNANGMEYNRAWKVQVGKLMYDLEQKYFPKEMKSDGR